MESVVMQIRCHGDMEVYGYIVSESILQIIPWKEKPRRLDLYGGFKMQMEPAESCYE